jgi:phosphoribosylformylglycinamidine cyclo-ligase
MQYRQAGVDIDRANSIVRGIGQLAPRTWGSRVLSDIGSFGGLFDAAGLGDSPVLVASIDGVGTKSQVARILERWEGLGIDLVHHSVNDILVQGARPLFFLDYLASSALHDATVLDLVQGMTTACQAHDCALLGGETAEMPGTYTPGDIDVVGCIIGVAERRHLLTGERVAIGDEVWGLPSSGLHTNGYSLARKVLLQDAALDLHVHREELGDSLGTALLEPHRSYFGALYPLVQDDGVHALAHITGGGFLDNIPRLLPSGCDVEIDPRTWEIPALFRLIQHTGDIGMDEMRRVFNLGIGMVVLLSSDQTTALRQRVPDAVQIGRVVRGDRQVRFLD